MKPIDVAKAVGIAAAVLVLDVALAVAVVYVWSLWIASGHSREFYAAQGVPVARLSTRVLGTALIFMACWWFGRRNPQRDALWFAVMIVLAYGLLDGASVAFNGFFTLGFGITMALKTVAALAGGGLAGRVGRARAVQ